MSCLVHSAPIQIIHSSASFFHSVYVSEWMHEVELDCRLFGVCIILHDLDWAITFNVSAECVCVCTRGALTKKCLRYIITMQIECEWYTTSRMLCVCVCTVHYTKCVRFIEKRNANSRECCVGRSLTLITGWKETYIFSETIGKIDSKVCELRYITNRY